ncbi:AAA family ATPase [Spirosoma foliorum]|uniref:AAA family ATPase n=1 Tax=Spirosoma foliorum TaxID=2710596 RepID=UPI001C71263B|nr:AAA family ATPase [Spirosoma foliorum]
MDTENGSADLYSHLGDYNVLSLTAPFSPERYIDAIRDCENAGMEAIIIDSISHEWDGKGGCLEIVDQLGGKFQNWAQVTPRHQSFIEAIVTSSCHIITTVRRKQDYDMTKDDKGRVQVQKAGLKEITREGFEYELTANIEMDTRHNATASKDRTGLFMGKPAFIPSEQTGELIREWCESGIDIEQETKSAIAKLANCASIDELKELKATLSPLVHQHPDFMKAAKTRYAEVQKQVATIE